MPLDYQVAPVEFTKGLDTRSARKLVVAGQWDTLINASFSEDGSLRRRDGYEALLASQAGNGLATLNNELLLVNGPDLSTVSVVGTNVAKQAPGQLPYVDVEKREVVFNGANHDSQDMAYGDGYACYVWRDYAAGGGTVTGIKCSVVDLATGAKLINSSTVINSATATSPRVVFADNAFFIFCVDTPNMYCTVIATTAPSTQGVNTSIIFDANLVNQNFDACEFGTPAAFIAYRYADGVTSVRVSSVTRVGTVPSIGSTLNAISQAAVTQASIQALAICGYPNGINMGVFAVHTAGGALAGGLVGAVFSIASFLVTTAATLLDGTVPPVASATHLTAIGVGNDVQTFFDQQSSYLTANLRPLRSGVWSSTLVATSPAYTLVNSACFRINAAEASGPQGPFIAGKAFASSGVAFLPVAMLENYGNTGANTATRSTQCSFFLLRCELGGAVNFQVVAGALYRTLGLMDPTGGGAAPTVSTPPSTPALASGFGLVLQERGRLELTNGFNMTAVGLSHLTLTPRTSTPGMYAQQGETLYTSGGQLGAYDGQQVLQHGFPLFPEGISAVVIAGAGAVLTVGVHQLVAVYEWTDGAGERHQSAPSLAVSVTVANATDRITVLVPTTQLPQSAGWDASISTLSIVLYMTTAGGLTFYRCPTTGYAPVLNDVLASTVTLTVGGVVVTDTVLAANEPLYTQPNQAGTTLPNIAPGPVSALAVSQERVWYAKADQPFEYGYSQEPLENTGLQFSETLGGRVPSDTGDLVAIAELDEKTILFCERAPYVVYGTGPTPSGSFNNFSKPQRIPSDVGCSDPLSVVDVPAGLIFKSEKGWCLLGRDLSVRYIGDGAERWNGFTFTSAVMIEDRQEVRFASRDPDCPTLVFSYLTNAWSVFYVGGFFQPGPVAAAIWWPATQRYVHLQPTGAGAAFPGLMQDTPGVFVDGAGTASPVGFYVFGRTSWLHVSALEGFQKVRRLYLTGTAGGTPTSDLTVQVDYDDMPGLAALGSYTFTQDLGLITFRSPWAIDVRHKLARMKCKSVAFSFLEGSVDTTKLPLMGLQAMALEVGLRRGLNRLPAGQTV